MKTEVLSLLTDYERAVRAGAERIAGGELVVFPTETVYGIGADAGNEQAVRRIFEAKGRPADNPLIVHIAEFARLGEIAHVTPLAEKLVGAFWPGPFTVVLKSRGVYSKTVTGGLGTIAVRMPSGKAARDLITLSGKAIAAPSANISGRPSATTAEHALLDFDGRVPLILDGGSCSVGLESTVCDVTGEEAVILRPGGVSLEMIQKIDPKAKIAPAAMEGIKEGESALSPGMKYKHYAPRARVTIVKGEALGIAKAIKLMYDKEKSAGGKAYIFCNSLHAFSYGNRRVVTLGTTPEEEARALFWELRRADENGADSIYFEAVDENGIGLAIMNRALRAAAFSVVDSAREDEIEKYIAGLLG